MLKRKYLKQSLYTKGASQEAKQSCLVLQLERSTFRLVARHSPTNDSSTLHRHSANVALSWARHEQVFSRQLIKYLSRLSDLSHSENDESWINVQIFDASS